MAKLMRETNKQIVIEKLETATSFFSRLRGLLGHEPLEMNEGLWISPCNSIHTFFMSFTIDCVFLNYDGAVVALRSRVKPYRMVAPIFAASSVVELSAGAIEKNQIVLGERLHVVD